MEARTLPIDLRLEREFTSRSPESCDFRALLARREIGRTMERLMTRFRCSVAVMAAAIAFPLLAAAPGVDTVKVGKETKKTIGVVMEAVSGDVACYLKLKDDRGVVFDELADFAICEKPKLAGKRVMLKYSLEKVLADECQGDPDCKKSKTVALVTAVQVLGSAADKPAAPKSSPQASFCTPRETIVFACSTGAKLVSVCASKDASPAAGYLQYRFGKPDSRDPLEATIPEAEMGPSKAAHGQSETFAGGGGVWMRFRKGPLAYVVFSGSGKWGPHGETREKQGVVVERDGKLVANLPCSGKPASILGPDWLAKMGVKSNGEHFDFPE